MRPRIAILVCGHTIPPLIPRRGNFPDWFRRGLGLEPEHGPTLDLPAGDALPDPGEFDGVVVTGSPEMVTEEHDWSLLGEVWLRHAHERELPILGVCYGHQLLARALGGAAGWNPNGREIGTVEIERRPSAEDDCLFHGLPERFRAQSSHSQSVTELPPGAVLLASNGHDPHQAYRVGTRSWGVQFHPEFDADIVRGYVRHRAEAIEAEGLDPDALVARTGDDPSGAHLLRAFRAVCDGALA